MVLCRKKSVFTICHRRKNATEEKGVSFAYASKAVISAVASDTKALWLHTCWVMVMIDIITSSRTWYKMELDGGGERL